MAEKTKISWCDSTWNPWIGCTKVSDGCKFCYAEELMDKRYGKVKWGPQGARVRTTNAYWRKPVQWNKEYERFGECEECGWRGFPKFVDCPICHKYKPFIFGVRQRVFCASLADVFEDNPQVRQWRAELFLLIGQTPNLDWLLLTKRPENIADLTPIFVTEEPDNVWMGTTVENQEATERIGHLLAVPAKVHWLSVEPMIGPVKLFEPERLDWVIVGGESGAKCRPMNLQWARDLRDQCKEAGVAFFMKQLGGHPDKRDQMTDFPEDLQIREFPEVCA